FTGTAGVTAEQAALLETAQAGRPGCKRIRLGGNARSEDAHGWPLGEWCLQFSDYYVYFQFENQFSNMEIQPVQVASARQPLGEIHHEQHRQASATYPACHRHERSPRVVLRRRVGAESP